MKTRRSKECWNGGECLTNTLTSSKENRKVLTMALLLKQLQGIAKFNYICIADLKTYQQLVLDLLHISSLVQRDIPCLNSIIDTQNCEIICNVLLHLRIPAELKSQIQEAERYSVVVVRLQYVYQQWPPADVGYQAQYSGRMQ